MYYWLTEDLDKYVRIDAISFDGGQTWTDDFQVVIPEDIAADQMKIKAGYRFSTGDPTWEEYIVDYNIEDSRICVLSETLTRACLKNHFRNLQAPLCGIFYPHSVAVARYAALIRIKSPTN